MQPEPPWRRLLLSAAIWGALTGLAADTVAFAYTTFSFDLKLLFWAHGLALAVPLGIVTGCVCVLMGMMVHGLVMSVLPNRLHVQAGAGAGAIFLTGVGSALLLNFSGTYDGRFWLVSALSGLGSALYYGAATRGWLRRSKESD